MLKIPIGFLKCVFYLSYFLFESLELAIFPNPFLSCEKGIKSTSILFKLLKADIDFSFSIK
jgi:hypothetical protein